jgi:hypothetical protein
MSKRRNQTPSALKHGGYSELAPLPGENRAAFAKLHKDLIAEFNPVGRLEETIIETIARLTWRRQNLSTYRAAEHARIQYLEIQRRQADARDWANSDEEKAEYVDLWTRLVNSPAYARFNAQLRGEMQQTRRKMGTAAYSLATIPNVGSIESLLQELSIIDRLDGMIDRCLKRLLFVRGLKSISASSSTSPEAPHTKRLAAA